MVIINIPRDDDPQEKLLRDYDMMFNDSYPLMILGYDENIINDCLRQGKTVYELGYVELDDKKY